MRRASRGAGARLAALVAAFAAGVLVDSWLRVHGPPRPASAAPTERGQTPSDPGESREPPVLGQTGSERGHIAPTSGRPALRVPIDGVTVDSMKGGFAERRGGRPHEAVDMLAPRNTPVRAVQDGTIAKLFFSKAGGNTIYQFDPTGHLAYYYAHLQGYAQGIREGGSVTQGQVIGFVGTSGNAPPNTPHLHFAVFELNADRHWWQGRAIDPYVVFKDAG